MASVKCIEEVHQECRKRHKLVRNRPVVYSAHGNGPTCAHINGSTNKLSIYWDISLKVVCACGTVYQEFGNAAGCGFVHAHERLVE